MSTSLNQTNSKTELDKKTLLNRLGFPTLESSEGRIWTSRIRDNVPFIAITLVIIMFWIISGERFMSYRNWTFIAQQTPVLLLLAYAQLLIVTTGSIDISVGSNLGFSAYMMYLIHISEPTRPERIGEAGL